MSGLEALWLGIVQGLTEFFPVSSSGHLVIFQDLLGIDPEGGLLFEISVHVATLVAILVYYRGRVAELLAGVVRFDQPSIDYALKLGLATIPAVAVGLVGKDFVEQQFRNPVLVGWGLIATGMIVATTRWTTPRATRTMIPWSMALWIGCAQALAILPGISRSGSTVAMALALGLVPAVAAEFSFLLGTIAIAGAAVLMLPDLSTAPSTLLSAVAIGSVAALLSGLGAIVLFVRMLRAGTFQYFAIWAWLAGGFFLVWRLL
ncbi:MAG: undecaprenyl-diphosphate phosphatase [Myxococcota bacterium]|nr:undecaprenyl-diphosphate phosphatase [Myxococcota bacterium]